MNLHVLAEFHGFDFGIVHELADALVLVVVPDQHLVEREHWAVASPDECNYIRTIQHLDYSNASLEVYKSWWMITGLPL